MIYITGVVAFILNNEKMEMEGIIHHSEEKIPLNRLNRGLTLNTRDMLKMFLTQTPY